MNPGEPSPERFSYCSTLCTARTSRRQTCSQFCVTTDWMAGLRNLRSRFVLASKLCVVAFWCHHPTRLLTYDFR